MNASKLKGIGKGGPETAWQDNAPNLQRAFFKVSVQQKLISPNVAFGQATAVGKVVAPYAEAQLFGDFAI